MRDNKTIGIILFALLAIAAAWYLMRESSKHTDMMKDKQNFFPIEEKATPIAR